MYTFWNCLTVNVNCTFKYVSAMNYTASEQSKQHQQTWKCYLLNWTTRTYIVLYIEDLQNESSFLADLRFNATIVLYTKLFMSFQDLPSKAFSFLRHCRQGFFPGTRRSAIKLARCLCTALLSASLHGLFTFKTGFSANSKDRKDRDKEVTDNT